MSDRAQVAALGAAPAECHELARLRAENAANLAEAQHANEAHPATFLQSSQYRYDCGTTAAPRRCRR
jgi:hypothetical protein